VKPHAESIMVLERAIDNRRACQPGVFPVATEHLATVKRTTDESGSRNQGAVKQAISKRAVGKSCRVQNCTRKIAAYEIYGTPAPPLLLNISVIRALNDFSVGHFLLSF
jgi:hypothetical protein